jgi:hypothetical protein
MKTIVVQAGARAAMTAGAPAVYLRLLGDGPSQDQCARWRNRRLTDSPNVPDTPYYKESGYAVHGTYWHDPFGTDQSQGCINVTWTDGAYVSEQTLPTVAVGQVTGSAKSGASTVLIVD